MSVKSEDRALALLFGRHVATGPCQCDRPGMGTRRDSIRWQKERIVKLCNTAMSLTN